MVHDQDERRCRGATSAGGRDRQRETAKQGMRISYPALVGRPPAAPHSAAPRWCCPCAAAWHLRCKERPGRCLTELACRRQRNATGVATGSIAGSSAQVPRLRVPLSQTWTGAWGPLSWLQKTAEQPCPLPSFHACPLGPGLPPISPSKAPTSDHAIRRSSSSRSPGTHSGAPPRAWPPRRDSRPSRRWQCGQRARPCPGAQPPPARCPPGWPAGCCLQCAQPGRISR